MDVFKKQFEQIQKTLAGLSASQKMLTGALVVIMVMTLMYWGKYAGNSEMEPLFQSALSTDDLQKVTHVLEAENIPFDPSSDKIMVPVEKKDYALAALAYQEALPKDSTGGFDDVFSKINAFSPESTNDKLFNQATQQELANVIGHMPGVRSAIVHIDPSHDELIGGSVEPSASVNLVMEDPTKADKKLAEAIAETVAGSNARMRRSRVHVIFDGRAYPVKDPDPNLPDGEIDEQQTKAEAQMEDDVKRALEYFQADIMVVVHAKIDTITSHQVQTTFPKIVTKDLSNDTQSSSTNSTTPTSAEPGAQANTGGSLSVNGGGTTAGGQQTQTDTSQTRSEAFPDKTEIESTKPAGEPTAVSATVTVPSSYFVRELKGRSHSDKDPDPADVEKEFDAQRSVLVEKIMHTIGLGDAKQITVDMYDDTPLMMAVGSSSSSGGSSASSPITVTLSGHVKEIALGALALVSLFMVSSMVKKSSPAPIIAAAPAEQPGPAMIGRNLDIAGEVGEGDTALDGVEMDDDAIKSQQMVEQVSTLVKENPDAAATMVKRWLNRT